MLSIENDCGIFDDGPGFQVRMAGRGVIPDTVVKDIAVLEKVDEIMAKGDKPDLTMEEKQAIGRIFHSACFIYFVLAEGTNKIKIGQTNKPHARMASLRTMSAVPLRPIAMIRAHTSYEKLLHRALQDHRSHGEWFHATPQVLDLIEQAIDGGFAAIDRFVMDKGLLPWRLSDRKSA